jgi:hypothetical protein
LNLSVAFEGLETVVRRNSKFFDSDDAIEDGEFPKRHGLEILEPRDSLALE